MAVRKAGAQPSSVNHHAVGDIVVSTINDGIFEVSLSDIVGVDPAVCEAAHRDSFRDVPPWLTINTFLVRLGDRLALIDTGFAERRRWSARCSSNLTSVGVVPGDIDAILMTHMHPDHEAGLDRRRGQGGLPERRADRPRK